jgi:anti-anti-sigma factor
MSNPATYQFEINHGRAVISLLPALNEVPWADIEKIGSEAVTQLNGLSSPRLVVDLTALSYMGSAQVALVVRLFKAVKERDGKMVVANRHPLVQEVLTLAGLNKLWTIVDSREAALKLLGGSPLELAGPSGGGLVPGLAGLVVLAVSGVSLVALITRANWLAPETALQIELLSGAVAFGMGLFSLLKGARLIGSCVLVGSVAVLLAGVFSLGVQRQAVPTPSESAPESAPELATEEPAATPAPVERASPVDSGEPEPIAEEATGVEPAAAGEAPRTPTPDNAQP